MLRPKKFLDTSVIVDRMKNTSPVPAPRTISMMGPSPHRSPCPVEHLDDVIDDATMASNAVMLAEKIFLREAAADGPLPREKLLSKCFMKMEFSFPFSKKRFYKTAATISLSALDHLFLPL